MRTTIDLIHRVGRVADHAELLRVEALRLEPNFAPNASMIHAAYSLRNDALEPELVDGIEELGANPNDMRDVAQSRFSSTIPKHVYETILSLDEWLSGEILLFQNEVVEDLVLEVRQLPVRDETCSDASEPTAFAIQGSRGVQSAPERE